MIAFGIADSHGTAVDINVSYCVKGHANELLERERKSKTAKYRAIGHYGAVKRVLHDQVIRKPDGE